MREVLDLHRAREALETIDSIVGEKHFDRVLDCVGLRAAGQPVEKSPHQVVVDVKCRSYGISLADSRRVVNLLTDPGAEPCSRTDPAWGRQRERSGVMIDGRAMPGPSWPNRAAQQGPGTPVGDGGPELRRYWNPRFLLFMAAYELLGLAAFSSAIATAGARASWSSALPWVILFVVAFFGLAFAVVRAGVSESEVGITLRAAGYGFDVRWDEVAAFDYGRRRGGEVVVLRRIDGRRSELRGVGRRMRWRGGMTDDFVALLNSRLAQHHANSTP